MSNKVEYGKEDEYHAGNSKAKEMMDKIRKGKASKPKKKPVIDFHSIISGLSWRTTGGVNLFNIFDLTIYQFYDGYYRLENIDHYNSILTGIYTGNIDAKNIKMQDINWARII